MVIRAGLSGG
jgi:hypothetical protein